MMTVLRPADLMAKMEKIRQEGRPRKGISTGLNSVDELILLNKRRLFFVTGVPGQGKSEFVDMLAVNTAILHQWCWTFFSPESDPQEGDHLQNLIEKRLGKKIVSSSNSNLSKAVDWASGYFSWIMLKGEESGIDGIMAVVRTRMAAGEKIDALVVDPWNQLNHIKQQNQRDDIYLGACLTRLADFAKELDLFVVVVIHPHGIQKNKDGEYPIVHIREGNGGITWYAKADYAICVNRADPRKHGANIYIQKVKTRAIGKIGMVYLDYEPEGGRFKSHEALDYSLPDEISPAF